MKTQLCQKLKKYRITKYTLGKVIAKILTFLLLFGLAYLILYPFLFKILSSFMSEDDLYNVLVNLIPMDWSLDTYKYIIEGTDFIHSAVITLLTSLLYASLTTFSTALIGYGLAKFKIRGSKIIMGFVIFSIMIPLYTLRIPMYMTFRFFDFFGLFKTIFGNAINILDTPIAYALMSACGMSFRAGIFIILIRQYYLGIPNELTEAAYVDGSGPYSTYFRIILPMARSMMIVIFSLSFAWSWTDTYFSDTLTPNMALLSRLVLNLNNINGQDANYQLRVIQANTSAILAVLPLVIFYCFLQKKIIQGIERSGLVG